MSHGTGRHRRRRRGWADRVRWALGAVLAAIVGAEPPVRHPNAGGQAAERPLRKVPSFAAAASRQEPEWVRRHDEARRAQDPRMEGLCPEGPEPAERHRTVRLPQLGWCVDDSGMRAVRPYLVAHEQHLRAQQQRRAAERIVQRARRAAHVPATGRCESTGEWDELADLIRQWKAQQVPVA